VDGVIEAVPDCLLEAQMPLWQVYPLPHDVPSLGAESLTH